MFNDFMIFDIFWCMKDLLWEALQFFDQFNIRRNPEPYFNITDIGGMILNKKLYNYPPDNTQCYFFLVFNF